MTLPHHTHDRAARVPPCPPCCHLSPTFVSKRSRAPRTLTRWDETNALRVVQRRKDPEQDRPKYARLLRGAVRLLVFTFAFPRVTSAGSAEERIWSCAGVFYVHVRGTGTRRSGGWSRLPPCLLWRHGDQCVKPPHGKQNAAVSGVLRFGGHLAQERRTDDNTGKRELANCGRWKISATAPCPSI